jgi:hypothetical protein
MSCRTRWLVQRFGLSGSGSMRADDDDGPDPTETSGGEFLPRAVARAGHAGSGRPSKGLSGNQRNE